MGRRGLEEVDTAQLKLVYIAGNVPDAQAAEACFAEMGLDYAVNLESFTTTSVLGGVYVGAFMYVPAGRHQECRTRLEACGLTDTIALASETPETFDGA
jgi:hypothetical protein